jgi:hypothetical protein
MSRDAHTFPTAAALIMARAMRRLAVKYGDLGLARRAKELDKRAQSALAKKQTRALQFRGRQSAALSRIKISRSTQRWNGAG